MPQRPAPPNTVARLGFVSVALEVALTFCRLAREADERHSDVYIAKARKAYDIANRYMFEFDKSAREFHSLTASAERVKLMLDSLQTRNSLPAPPLTQPTAELFQ